MTLQDIQSTRTQYLSTLKKLDSYPFLIRAESKFNQNSRNFTLIRAIITGSFTPAISSRATSTPSMPNVGGSSRDRPTPKSTKFWIRNEKGVQYYFGQMDAGENVSVRMELKRLRVLLDQVIENRLSNPEQERQKVDEEILDIVTKSTYGGERQR
ncbi:hypothetical protein JCM33374_g6652 [Metschnikowia sp. JCM 33374]|nr:hypothetical protein JCM33374_g6652 [Metschnikowia sp. JCM 33374]